MASNGILVLKLCVLKDIAMIIVCLSLKIFLSTSNRRMLINIKAFETAFGLQLLPILE